jgi:hypothetical protein
MVWCVTNSCLNTHTSSLVVVFKIHPHAHMFCQKTVYVGIVVVVGGVVVVGVVDVVVAGVVIVVVVVVVDVVVTIVICCHW